MASNAGNYPEWLKSLLGDFPLLSDSELDFIANIRSQIMSEIKSEQKLSFDEGKNLKKKLSTMKDNFKQVVKHLKMKRKHCQYFIDKYIKWRLFRDINVQQLRKIANSIQDERQKCQTANFIGSCVSLIGGVICLAGGLKSNRVAGTGGSTMMSLGSLTSAGSSIIEIGLLHKRNEEAKQIMNEDKECSEHLWEWLSEGSHLKEAMDSIRYIDVETTFKWAANKFQNAFNKNRSKSKIEKVIKNVLSSLDISPKFAEEISDVIGILMTTAILYDRHRPLFDLAFTCSKLKLELNAAVNIFRAACAVNYACRMKKHMGQVGAGMVLDAVNILFVCKDSKSLSKQAEMVTKAANMLEKEAQIFENLYNEIHGFDVDDPPKPVQSHDDEMKASFS